MGGDYENSRNNNYHRERNRDESQRTHRYFSNNRRSSDYRTDFSHPNNNNNDSHNSGERHYRSQNDYSYKQDKQYRERRSRSPERSHKERDNRSYNEDDRDYYRRDNKREDKKETPNNTLMARNIATHISDKDIAADMNSLGFYPRDIRLMRNRETGESRGFAFIEFSTLEEAIQLKETTQGVLVIDGQYECSLHYSFPKDSAVNSNVDKNMAIKMDWNCPKCGINNFKRRDECFKCGSHRDAIVDPSERIQLPTSVLILRNLSFLATEEKILSTIGSLTPLPFKSVRIVSDPSCPQANMCSLELHSIAEATEMMSILSSLPTGLVIDNCLVPVSYGRKFEFTNVSTTGSTVSKQAAAVALAAAQWKNMEETSKEASKKAKPLEKVTINGVEYTKYDAPDYNSFQYDASSGYYYDASTGYHYDSNSQYFYNSKNQKYMYYDTTNAIYVTVDSTGQVVADSNLTKIAATPAQTTLQAVPATKHNTDIDKAKMAKKIAKDIEKWAKMCNQQKEMVKVASQQFEANNDNNNYETCESTEVESVAISKLERRSISPEVEVKDPFVIIKEEEQRLTDLSRLACLLCKRQFGTPELLNKHQQMSELHKNNLNTLRQTLLNQEQLEHVAKVERDLAYRDRAKERRDKFGFDDTPEYPKRKFDNISNDSPDVPSSSSISSAAQSLPISDNNIGSKMLKAMGWSEGKGLGKSNQGMSGIIEVAPRKEGLGLGVKDTSSPVTDRKESYKDAVRRTAFQRFKEMS